MTALESNTEYGIYEPPVELFSPRFDGVSRGIEKREGARDSSLRQDRQSFPSLVMGVKHAEAVASGKFHCA